MPSFSQATVANRLLKALAPEAFERLSSEMAAIDLGLRQVVVESDAPISHVCFIESGLASMVAVSSDNEVVEAGSWDARVLVATMCVNDRPHPE
ncbi:hypothetical protein AJ87_39195 [Rhizobium yanglingense]|nr:hypothetical protein AJ87_39195 [Rhizobium yanglingense]